MWRGTEKALRILHRQQQVRGREGGDVDAPCTVGTSAAELIGDGRKNRQVRATWQLGLSSQHTIHTNVILPQHVLLRQIVETGMVEIWLTMAAEELCVPRAMRAPSALTAWKV
jgi:hypothetical protein